MIWASALAPNLAGERTDEATLRSEAQLLAALVSPALAKFLIEPVERRIGATLIDDGHARKSRLLNRLNAARQARWISEIADGGFAFLCLKGYAHARSIYPDAALRSTGDLDVLVRRRDLAGLVDFLERRGFTFASAGLPRWGFISDASFVPFVGPDGENIDLHIHPDAFPAHAALSTELAFARARRIAAEDGSFLAPSPEHALILCITNAAKDKFGPFAATKLVDAARLIETTPALDWDEVAWLARKGHFHKPALVFLALLVGLGFPADSVPARLRPEFHGITGREFRRLVASWRALFAERTGSAAVVRRELVLCTEPRVGLHNTLARLRGLVAPRSGIPRFKERRI
jgi:Uncharacterised nucleotidyltransferase